MEHLALLNIGKIIALLVSTVSLSMAIQRLSYSKKNKLRADYVFAEKFLVNDKWNKMNDYLLEQGYWGLTGRQIDAGVIRYFMKHKDPLFNLTDYAKGQRFMKLERDTKGNVMAIELDKKVAPNKYWLDFKFYFFVCFSLAPLFVSPFLLSQGFSGVMVLVASCFSFGIFAFLNLADLWTLQSAIRLDEKGKKGLLYKQLRRDVEVVES